jgi:DNA-binding MarR family transcriptional regulator
MKTHDNTDQVTAAWTRFQRMHARLTDRLNREIARETGLSQADFEILCALIQQPDTPVRALALRCGIEWEKSRLSHQLRRMEQRNLVTREVCEEDNRSILIRVTPTGRSLAEAARHLYDSALTHYVTDALTRDQIDALDEISESILAQLGDQAHS